MTTPRQPQASAAGAIESVLHENRLFPPPSAASLGFAKWHVDSMERYRAMHERSLRDPEGFWGEVAADLHWFTPWSKVCEWTAPDARWFVGGTTNIAYNCVDRQVNAGLGDQAAIVWEGEPLEDAKPEVRTLTYRDLLRESSKLANVLKALGVKKGDVVTIYMGMVPELAVALLACARIGAPHSVIFGGFSAQAIADRVTDASSRVIITADGAWRRGKVVPLKENVDAACAQLERSGYYGGPTGSAIDHVIVLRRCGNQIVWHPQRDHWWQDLTLAASADCPAEPMNSEDMLFLLYTSGSTGKPKGIMHTTGGYMVYTYLTSKVVFNLEGDGVSRCEGGEGKTSVPGVATSPLTPRHPVTSTPLYWCTADIGWVTGHSYILYGILPNRVPTFMYEGAPNSPGEDRFWDIIQRHRITHFYTAPTAIRAFMKWGDEHPRKHDLSSLRLLGSVGEPINPEAWTWYNRLIGGGSDTHARCPIVDTWWQTETGGHMITPLPGVTPTKPGSCTLPFFGVDAAIVNDRGEELGPNQGGMLVVRKPWPSMLRGIFGDRHRFIETYFSKVKDPVTGEPYYFTGDGARRDEHGYFWVMGRIDDVINVAGHRLGTMEVESALVSHEAVVEAAVVGMPHDIKGTGIAAFVTLAPAFSASDDLRRRLCEHVAKEIGAIARPDQVRFTPALPKTRSGKIMRRLLRDIAAGVENTRQDTTTLEDFSVLAKLRESDEA
jgi:acetyl-CoA synthetase